MIAPAPFLVAPHPVPGESDDATETPRPGLGGTPSLADLFAVLDEPAPWSHVAPMTLSEIVAAWWDGEEGL